MHRSSTTFAGRLGRGFQRLLLLGAGLAFLSFTLWFSKEVFDSFDSARDVADWYEVESLVTHSEVLIRPESDPPYEFVVSYRYEIDGLTYESQAVSPSYAGSNDLGETQELADQYPEGTTVRCRVDPQDPARAYLQAPSTNIAWAVLFGLPFLGIGVFLVWYALLGADRNRLDQIDQIDQAAPKAITADPTPTQLAGPVLLLALFFGAFLFLGLVATYFVVYLPFSQQFASGKWAETRCTLIESWVESHSGDDSTTYSAEVLFEYEVRGRTYRSDRRTFFEISTGSDRGSERWVKEHPRGSVHPCWYNPDIPSEAVFERRFEAKQLLGLFTLLFVAVGGGGLFFILKGSFKHLGKSKG